jgi:hypothetical protein
VRDDLSLSQITLDKVKPDAPPPKHNPTNYLIFEVGVDVTSATVKVNQSPGQTKHTGMDPKKHSTRFDT